MLRHNDLCLQLRRSAGCGVEVVEFEPQQDAIAIGLVVWIADRPMVMFDFEAVKLQDQGAVGHQTLILRAAMRTLAIQQTLIPAAAGFDIANAYERLWSHEKFVG